jgi:DNA-binding NtrC family response regulator
MPGRILIIDDDAGFAEGLARSLRLQSHEVTTFTNAGDARRGADASADVVVVDYQLPDADGLALIDELRQVAGSAVFLMATAFPNVEIAVEAMRRGAFDYVAKGSDPRECLMRIERGVEVALLRRRVADASHTPGDASAAADALLGESVAMRKLRQRLDALAESPDTTVLVVGETGTGKGVVTRLIHARSSRAFEPFVAVDCTTIPATLVESELFGHEKGSFSGATGTKLGRVEAAGNGTLFLDEIGELELPIQMKLLRLLEEREYTRVGSTRTRRLTARIITATNRDLTREVAEGRFRADLRYRLEVFVLEVPPLRERGDDVLLLATHFARASARAVGRKEPKLAPDAVTALLRYPFPGNVRELRNMVEQAVLLARGTTLPLEAFPVLERSARGWAPASEPPRDSFGDERLTQPGHNPAPAPFGPAPAPGTTSSRPIAPASAPPNDGPPSGERPSLADIRGRHVDLEHQEVVRALDAAKGNVAAAARLLGLSRFQLLRRLAKHGLR